MFSIDILQVEGMVPSFHIQGLLFRIWLAESHEQQGNVSDPDETGPAYLASLQASYQLEFAKNSSFAYPNSQNSM